MSYLLRRFKVAYTCGPFYGTRYVWAPNKGSAKSLVRTRLPASLLPEFIGEAPSETLSQYPVLMDGAFDPSEEI